MTEPAPSSELSKPPKSRWFQLRDFAPLISLLVIVMFFTLTVSDFLSLGKVRLVLQQGAVLAIVATGLTYVLLCAEIDLSVGMLALWTACACGVMFEQPYAAGPGGEGEISTAALVLVLAIPILSCLLLGLLSGALTVDVSPSQFHHHFSDDEHRRWHGAIADKKRKICHARSPENDRE